MRKIKIVEVGLRDGLQNEKKILTVQEKLNILTLLKKANLKTIELTSFVRADRIPQFADSEEFSKSIQLNEGIHYSALTPNKKGLEKAIELGYKEIAIFGAASETFTKKNINRTIAESLNDFKEVSQIAKQNEIKIRAYISTVFHCPYEGKISTKQVLPIIEEMLNLGAYEVSLGDTIGLASPNEVEELLIEIKKMYPIELFAGHFHDTYNFALLNVHKSIELGIRIFDSSIGGLGGCPYAKGASGNLATEDLVHYLHKMNFETGIHLEDLINTCKYIETVLGRELNSKTYQVYKNK
jgi:hydroxymethylglutaryl-CoA lyase